MKTSIPRTLLTAIPALAAAGCTENPAPRPNVIFILMDDAGDAHEAAEHLGRIASHPADYAAMRRAVEVLREGDLLGIFPEGRLTTDGLTGEFKGGIHKILREHPCPVVPMALQNLWGSFFSRVDNGRLMTQPFRRGFFSRVGLNIGQPMSPAELTPDILRNEVERLLHDRLV